MPETLCSHVRRNLVAYIALGLALALTGGVAYSAIPDANHVIHGCYDSGNGALRVIDTEAGGVCRGGETAIDWNQQGPPGAPGAQGPQGEPGSAGVSTVYARSAAGPLKLPNLPEQKTVTSFTVPRGSYAISGKAMGGTFVSEPDCNPNPGLAICSAEELLERRLSASAFACIVKAGTSSDLGATNLIPGLNSLSAVGTVSANLVVSLPAVSNKVSLICGRYVLGTRDVKVTNARLIATRVDRVNPLNPFTALKPQIRKAKVRFKLRAKP
jgi:hypothetical protein